MHNKGNYKQGEKAAFRMEENNRKQKLISKIYKQFMQLNTSSIIKWAKELKRHFCKEDRWLTNIWKDAQHHSLSEKCKSKPQWGTISHQSEWLPSKSLQTINTGEGVVKRERSRTFDGNVKRYNHYGRHYTATSTAKSLQLCPTLWDPTDSSPPGSPVPGILQARTLEWVAISFSNAWK